MPLSLVRLILPFSQSVYSPAWFHAARNLGSNKESGILQKKKFIYPERSVKTVRSCSCVPGNTMPV